MKYLILVCVALWPIGFAFADDPETTDPTFSKPSIFDYPEKVVKPETPAAVTPAPAAPASAPAAVTPALETAPEPGEIVEKEMVD